EQKGEDLNVNDVKKLTTDTSIGLILADIDQAKLLSPLRAVPDFKVGLLRAEFVLGAIGVHYKALKAFDAGVLDEAIALAQQPGAADKKSHELAARMGNKEQSVSVTDRERLLYETLSVEHGPGLAASLEATKKGIAERLQGSGYATGHEFYVEMLSQKISLFAHAFDGKDVIYRTTDYKSNEYRGLMGGKLFEGEEDNPMLGYRGVSRGVDAWEIEAFVKARREYGAKNLHLMFPFVRTEEELMNTVATSAAQGLKRGEDGLKVFVMAEIPSVASIPHTFLQHVDGFSIGSNDMTQGVLMTDRDSAKLQHTYDEEDPAVVQSMLSVIFAARKVDKEVGFCGQGVSNSEFIAAMVSVAGIDSASVTPDAYVKVKRLVHEIEARKIGVAGLGAWMNEYRAQKMNDVLKDVVAAHVFDGVGAAKPKGDMAPAEAYDWLQTAMVQANTLALSSEPAAAEKGRAQLAALRQAAKTVIYANTDWSKIVDTALRTAGFANAAECDDAIAARRAAHAHG
ncbi:MAG TPA: putative PEP-binding protein, partial [Myxococcota bacterium]